ncbi:hypothetical protein GQ607_003376 [Colletotrichum asianum]|uniref:Uncharacterized protein n=1 Tax=Colletotrichum asianum TaxID=702518 RepID=A0A8H3WP91_9PEZI|nr:hypothetical protein GQ607_003376 [Colletotrichum asianum]
MGLLSMGPSTGMRATSATGLLFPPFLRLQPASSPQLRMHHSPCRWSHPMRP